MFCNIGFAEMRLIEEKYLKGDKPDNWGYFITTVCVDGYKFVVVAPSARSKVAVLWQNERSYLPLLLTFLTR